MSRVTHILFFAAAAIFALNGGIGILHGDTARLISGLSQGGFWLIIGVSVKRRQKANQA